MRHPTVLISWLNFAIVHDTYAFHIQYHKFEMPIWRFSAALINRSTMQVSTFEVVFSSSKIVYLASFDILPLQEDIACAGNLHPYLHSSCGNKPSSGVE